MHIDKYKRTAVYKLLEHNEPSKVRANRENVNSRLTHKNYNFVSGNGYDNFKKVFDCDDIHKSNRRDLNVLCSVVLTVPNNLPESRRFEFFKHAFMFFNSRYKCPCVSAWVHNDEKKKYLKDGKIEYSRSHLHYAFVPIAYDEKLEKYKISYKDVITRDDLWKLHIDFKDYIDKKMKLNLEILNGATDNGNKSVLQLKNQSLKNNIENLEKLKKRVQNEIERELCR